MAVTAITPIKLKTYNSLEGTLAYTAATAAADGFLIPYAGEDHKTLIFLQNTNASTTARTATIKKGNGIQGVTDVEIEVDAGDVGLVCIESGLFKNVSGTDKGKVKVIVDNAELKIAVVELP